jgi:ribonuclease P protein component
MAKTNEKFGKAYKLCHEKKIESVFKDGQKLFKFPFRAHYIYSAEILPSPFQVVIAVPKRSFKKAHDRNRLKRLIREGIRKNKLILEEILVDKKINLSFVLIYSHNEPLEYQEIQEKIKLFFTQLINEVKHEKIA